jgi:hypothetical protein
MLLKAAGVRRVTHDQAGDDIGIRYRSEHLEGIAFPYVTEVVRVEHEEAMLLAPRDAGRLLGITSAGVTRLCERGQIPAIRDSANRRLFRAGPMSTVSSERGK